MAQTICKLCLFKTEPLTDEVCIEESQQLNEIIEDLFHKNISLSKLELDGVCLICRDKLRSYHEYYKFVLENQKVYEEKNKIEVDTSTEFIGLIKEGSEHEVLEVKETRELKRTKKRRVQKPRSYVLAIQQQQSDLIATLFKFKCSYCAVPEFDCYKEIMSHCKKVHGKSNVWLCCEKELTRDLDLIEHIMEHKGEWTCQKCTLPFSTAQALWMHNNKLHSEHSYKIAFQDPKDWLKRQLICDLCNQNFRTRGLIAQHMKDAHIRNFLCAICNAAFYDRVEAARHRKIEHASVLKVPCPFCKVMIKNKVGLVNSHIKNLHKNEAMICPYCGKVCNNDRIYRNHMIRNHKPPKHKCKFCSKVFKTKVQMEDHEAIHTGIPRYICSLCGSVFKSQGNYTAHRRKLHKQEHEQQKKEREAKRYKL